MSTSFQNSPYFICHYGVKGRSGKEGAGLWYKNGELTEAGRKHYLEQLRKSNPMSERHSNSPASENIGKLLKRNTSGVRFNKNLKGESSTWKSKDAEKLSDAELNRRNSRLQREQQYKNMTKSNARKAAEWVGKTAGAVLVTTAIGVLKGKMNQMYKTKIDSFLKADFLKINLSKLR